MTQPDLCLSGSEACRLDLPFAPKSARVARARLVESLRDHLDDAHRDDARLVVSELVSNSVRHGQPLADGTVRIAWCTTDDTLHIAVTDGGSHTAPRARRAGVSDLGGRGLSIVETVASGWWVETGHTQTTVHAHLALT